MALPSGFRSHNCFAVKVILLLSLACCSCSNNSKRLFPVKGKVLFDGGPAAKALVIFHPMNDPDPAAVKPRAIVATDGSFEVFTNVARDGVPAGEYVVTVIGEKPRKTKQSPISQKKMEIMRELPLHYENPKTSELRARVEEGANELPPFHLKKK